MNGLHKCKYKCRFSKHNNCSGVTVEAKEIYDGSEKDKNRDK